MRLLLPLLAAFFFISPAQAEDDLKTLQEQADTAFEIIESDDKTEGVGEVKPVHAIARHVAPKYSTDFKHVD